MIHIRVLFFASLKDRAGVDHAALELEEAATVQDLKKLLAGRYPRLEEAMSSVLVSINREYAFDQDPLPDAAEVALFPPVSGGTGEPPSWFAITEEELDLDALLARITLPSTGAAGIFTGMVRAETGRDEPHQTEYLEYEAYRPMAEAKMRQVAQEIRRQWPDVEGIAIVQRIGKLFPGTPTVLIACTAGHRDSGVFEAARFGIDRLKEIVPIWKKEVSPEGQSWVEGHYHPSPGE
jgi:molybdopterin synthase catalytic subunit